VTNKNKQTALKQNVILACGKNTSTCLRENTRTTLINNCCKRQDSATD